MKKATDKQWTEMAYPTVLAKGKHISTQSFYNYMAIAPYDETQIATLSLAKVQKTHYKFDNIQIYSDVAATNVELSDTSVTLDVGDTTTLGAVFTPSNSTDTHIVWESTNTTVATVDKYGKVEAIGGGTATITATSVALGKVVSCIVKVNGVDPEITFAKTANGIKWDFTVNGTGIKNGYTVYVGMYNANDVLISVGSAPYAASGNTVSLDRTAQQNTLRHSSGVIKTHLVHRLNELKINKPTTKNRHFKSACFYVAYIK